MSLLGALVTIPFIDFEIPLDIIVLGLVTGTAYALFALGLSLVYQNSRVLNFAQGAMGVVPQLMVASFVVDRGISYWVALPLALLVAAASGALVEFLVIRRLAKAPRLVVLVATIGFSQLLLIPVAYLIDLNDSKMGFTAYPVPIEGRITIGNLTLTAGHLIVLGAGPLIVAALTLFLRRTSVGIASRAIAENSESAELIGVPTRRISMIIWTIAGLLAGVAAILAGPTKPILAGAFTGGAGSGELLLRGLGAAMLGGLTNLPQVAVAGIGIGVLEALVLWNYPSGGVVDLVIAVVVVGSLVARRDLRQAARGGEESSWSMSAGTKALPARLAKHPRVRMARWIGAGLLALVLIVVLPVTATTSQVLLYTAVLLYVMIGFSLVILTGWAGQVSLGHWAFVAIGAIVGGRMQQLGYPMWGAIVFAVAAGALASLLVGLPALRIRGLFLAVTTLAFAVAVDSWLRFQPWLVGEANEALRLPRPKWWGIDFQDEHNYYYLVLALVVVLGFAVQHLGRTGIARRITAIRDNEPMAASMSVSPAGTKLLAFMVSGAIASFAGFLYGMLLVSFARVGITAPGLSQSMVIMVILGGATSLTGAVLGATYIRGLPYFFHSATVQLLSSGLGVLLVLLFLRGGLAAAAFRLRDRIVGFLVPGAWEDVDDAPAAEAGAGRVELRPREVPPERVPSRAIVAEDIVMRYGGVTALGGVSVHADQGEIVGLIGPNGAGKTTLFDVLSGHVRPTSGRVGLFGEDVTDAPPEYRATRGLARTFQQARLFDDLSIVQAFEVALERNDPTEFIPSMLALPPSWAAERSKQLRAWELVELLGLGHVANRKAIELSTGTRRICELGVSIALDARLVLLDEPTGGVAQREVEAFTPLLRQIRDHLDATMVVVAHDVPMITGLVDRVYVLAGGLVIAEEHEPARMHENAEVVAAYLGTDQRVIQSSGARATAGRAPRRAPLSASGDRRPDRGEWGSR